MTSTVADERSAITRLDCLLEGKKLTEDLIKNQLEPTASKIKSNLETLNEDVFAGPAAEVSREGLSDFYKAINNPVIVSFTSVAKALEITHKIKIEMDKKVEGDITYVYNEKGQFNMYFNQNGSSESSINKGNFYVDSNSGWIFPIAKGQGAVDTSYGQFGTNSQAGYGGTHNGIDVVAKAGTPIYAASDAEVYYSGWDPWTRDGSGGYGNCVVLRTKTSSGSYVYQIYAHMQNNPGLKPGSRISAGQQIGRVGTSGNTPGGAHLHFEIRNGLTWNGDSSLGIGNFYGNGNARIVKLV